MKTLSYYKQLRESYACIIPKTAPAYELIEALDALIASLQPNDANYSIFDYYGQQLRIPKGWRMVREGTKAIEYTLIDASNVAFGKVRKTTECHAWAYVDRDPGLAGYQSTLRGALLGLIDRAWGSVDAAS